MATGDVQLESDTDRRAGARGAADVKRLMQALEAERGGHPTLLRRARDGRLLATVRPPGESPRAYTIAESGRRVRVERLEPERDTALAGAALLADPERLALLLGGHATVRAVQLVAYRPAKRAVARVEFEHRPACYLKLLSARGYRSAVETFASLPAQAGEARLSRPWKLLDDQCALVADAVGGVSVNQLLFEGAQIDALALLCAIDDFTRAVPSDPLASRTVEDERASALTMLSRGAAWHGELRGLADVVAAVALPVLDRRGLLHTDLHDKQVFVHGEGISLIDLEGCAIGDPRIDQVNFVEHCALRAQQGAAAAGELARRLARAWRIDDGLRMAALRGLVRARLAGVYAQRPGHERLVAELARGAAELLSGARS